MSYRIGKRFTFCASHQLEELPEGHPCRRLHGHTYQVEVVLAADKLDEAGMVVDFHQVKQWIEPLIQSRFDHRHLNDWLPQPTAERIAQVIYESLQAQLPAHIHCVEVRVWESDTSWASYVADAGIIPPKEVNQ